MRAAMLREFVAALDNLPNWALEIAFDKWARTGARRPTPAEIRLLAERELQPLTDELARRKRIEDEAAEEARRREVTPEMAQRAADAMARAGFTADKLAAIRSFPMERSLDVAAERQAELEAPRPHWTDRADMDPELRAMHEKTLAKARAGNTLITRSHE